MKRFDLIETYFSFFFSPAFFFLKKKRGWGEGGVDKKTPQTQHH